MYHLSRNTLFILAPPEKDATYIIKKSSFFKRGQSYVTVICDAKARRVIDVEEGRDAETVVKFSYKLEEKGGDCSKIKTFVSDMSAAYESAKEECFPQATQVIDKFHVKQIMLKSMDDVRQEEQGKKQDVVGSPARSC